MSLAVWEPGLQDNFSRIAKDIEIKEEMEDSFSFYRPVSLKHDENSIYILDSRDCVIKVFSKTGVLQTIVGRPGDGPGELSNPGDMDVYKNNIYVTDQRNIRIFHKDGKDLGGFNIPIYAHKILVLDEDTIVVCALPLPGKDKVKLLYLSSHIKTLPKRVLSCHLKTLPKPTSVERS